MNVFLDANICLDLLISFNGDGNIFHGAELQG